MSTTSTVLYIRAVDVDGGDPEGLSALEATFDVVVAEGAVDAAKRLADGAASPDCAVVEAALPELVSGLVSDRLAADTPLLVVGEFPAGAERALEEADAYVPSGREATVAERVQRLVEDRRVDAALDRHAALQGAVADLAADVATASERTEVEAAVYDHLRAVPGYDHVWIGARDGDDRLAVTLPVGGWLDGADLSTLAGGGDPTFVDRAHDTGQVTWTQGGVVHRGAAATESAGGPEGQALRSAAVPFVHGGEVCGVALVSTRRPDALDGAERALLADAGAVVGHALAALEAAEGGSIEYASTEGLENLVHDLRNPLGIAKSHLVIAREDDAPESLDRVESGLERIEEIVDRAADGLRGDPTLRTSTTDLGAIAERAWQTIDAGSAELVVEDAPTIRADAELVERLLTNLFQNAVEHGGPAVTVAVGGLETGFFVEDDGPGVPEADRETVFERGYSTTADGQGIGLSIVDDVADAHGWDVSLSRGRAGGARFEVSGVELVEEDAAV